jgi:hypothetical protein
LPHTPTHSPDNPSSKSCLGDCLVLDVARELNCAVCGLLCLAWWYQAPPYCGRCQLLNPFVAQLWSLWHRHWTNITSSHPSEICKLKVSMDWIQHIDVFISCRLNYCSMETLETDENFGQEEVREFLGSWLKWSREADSHPMNSVLWMGQGIHGSLGDMKSGILV